MVDERFHNTISDRFDVESVRHADPMRRLRRRVCWAVTLVSVLAVMYVWGRGDTRIYQARPVASPHRLFEHKCELCHHESFHLLKRTLGSHSAAFQHACKKCHLQDGADHHPERIRTEMVDDCTACHKEHQDHDQLIAVSDAHCVRCHRDLATSLASGKSTFSQHVSSLADHPEIAVVRSGGTVSETAEGHGATRVAEWLDGQWQDRGQLKFNHAVHMDALGVLVPTDHPEYGKQDQDGPLRTTLQCGSCHQPDSEGVRMAPVTFDRHCKSCHQLQFSRQLATIDESLAGTEPLPHASPEIIRGVLRDRLMSYIEVHPDLLGPPTGAAVARNPAKGEGTPSARDKWNWVEDRLPKVEALLFSDGGNSGSGDLKVGCQKCHQTTLRNGDRWDVVDPDVPSRWLAHARFPHDRHEMVRCMECHHGLQESDAVEDTGFVMLSTTAQDILMPSFNVCRSCHKGDSARQTGMVSGRCTDCHRYHGHTSLDTEMSESLQDYLEKAASRQGASE